MTVDNGFCIDCGAPSPTERCAPCQKRHNTRLQAEHEVLVRSMFRATEGRGFGRRSTKNVRAATRSDSAASS